MVEVGVRASYAKLWRKPKRSRVHHHTAGIILRFFSLMVEVGVRASYAKLWRKPKRSRVHHHTARHRAVFIFYIRKKRFALLQIPFFFYLLAYAFIASSIATAQATVIPTIGLLPAPIKPIISTCAGTEEEPANCASECILPIVSVIP